MEKIPTLRYNLSVNGVNLINFTENQVNLAKTFWNTSNFLSGPAGSGKTAIASAFLTQLLSEGIPGENILILVPQRSLGLIYQDTISQFDQFNNSFPTIQTMGGIAQRLIRLFWPFVLNELNFQEHQPPIFLTLETAQYYCSKVCEPYFEKGYFQTIHAEKQRIYSQILDNLNKAAVIGFDYQTVAQKLTNAWSKEPEHIIAYREAQECAIAFRNFCLENNLLDFSLQFEIFANNLWKIPQVHNYLANKYQYLIYDNSEEDVPVTHQIIREWLPDFDSSLIIYDEDGGFRAFLGADPISAFSLKNQCTNIHQLSGSWVSSETIQKLIPVFKDTLAYQPLNINEPELLNFVQFEHNMYFPKMIDSVVENISNLINQHNLPLNQIAILAPYVSDALRFQIQTRLEEKGLQVISHRPSRSLREENATHVMLTWAKLAHPDLKLKLNKFDIRNALTYSINGLDPLRAELMAQVLFSPKNQFSLNDVNEIRAEMQNRFTFNAAAQYAKIREWLLSYLENPKDLDIFLAQFFGEVLSQPGFGFHNDFQSAAVIAKLIESVQKFRRVTGTNFIDDPLGLTNEYIQMVSSGTIAASYLETWQQPDENAVYLSPAYTYIMQNRPVSVQIWLDIGSQGWWQRLIQPLTQPYVLSNNWIEGAKWTDINEFATNQQNITRLVTGLLRRCGDQVFMYTAGYNERGEEEKGYLLQAIQRLLKIKFQLTEQNQHV